MTEGGFCAGALGARVGRQSDELGALFPKAPGEVVVLGLVAHTAPLARARRCRHPRPDEAPEPLPVGPSRSLPTLPHRRRSAAHQERPLPIRQLPKEAWSPDARADVKPGRGIQALVGTAPRSKTKTAADEPNVAEALLRSAIDEQARAIVLRRTIGPFHVREEA
jgi:hypothetical protein